MSVPDQDIPPGGGDAIDLPYQSLYRRYRPQRFDEVKGQEHVTRALRNAVREGKVAHAYLFSGPRGTGKTSTARILAMALNCANPVDGEPDGVCNSCVEIRRGSSLDVHELDAASNRKLDEMRDLLSRVALGTRGRWKIYIVDEVHQLTPDAASALLKTLEEPPAHVVFVLATTDPQKVLPTIRSRTQHFEFRLLSADVLGQLLHDVNSKAALGVAPEAIDLVVRRGHGSARDALSVLDQVAAAGEVESEAGVVADITDALADGDAQRVLLAVAEGISAGREPRRLAVDLLDHLRNGFLAIQARQLVLLPDDAAAEVEAQARRLGLPAVVRAMEVIGQALIDMRDSVDARITLEVALVRCSQPRVDSSVAALLVRVDQLEQRFRELGHVPAQASAPAVGGTAAAGERPTSVPPAAVPAEAIAAPPSPAGPPPDAGRTFERPVPRSPSAAAEGQTAPQASAAPQSSAGPPPGPPAGRGRSALGAHRKSSGPPSSPAARAAGDPPGRPPAGASPPATQGAPTRNERAATVPRPPAGPLGAASAAGTAPTPGASSTPQPAAPAPSAPGPVASGRATRPMPTRDDLTEAWADAVLPTLRVPVRAFMATGHFLSADNGVAVFALPDRPLLDRAAAVKGEAEAALSEHFGSRIILRLVHDRDAAPPLASPEQEADSEDPAAYNLDELDDVTTAVVSPEERLLQAFPGAKEVDL